jgi:hypothetical protein
MVVVAEMVVMVRALILLFLLSHEKVVYRVVAIVWELEWTMGVLVHEPVELVRGRNVIRVVKRLRVECSSHAWRDLYMEIRSAGLKPCFLQ